MAIFSSSTSNGIFEYNETRLGFLICRFFLDVVQADLDKLFWVFHIWCDFFYTAQNNYDRILPITHNRSKHCIKNTYFSFRGEINKQIDKPGNLSLRIYTCFNLKYLKNEAIQLSKFTPKSWLRYVDDNFIHKQNTKFPCAHECSTAWFSSH